MGHKKRKQKNPAEPDNKKSAKLETEVEEAAQNITVEVLPKKNEKQEVQKEEEDTEEPKKEEEDMKEPKKEEGNGSQSSGKEKKKKNRKKKKNNANKASNETKNNKTLDANDGCVDDYVRTQEVAEEVMGALSKDNLELILKLALKKHGDIVREITEVASKDPSKRKLFIRGLGWETKPETLESVFSAYGEVEKAHTVINKNSGKNKGFGFVTFKTFAGAMAALKEPNKQIDYWNTICSLSTGVPDPDPLQVTARKIYVWGPLKYVDSDRLVELFSQYVEIEEDPVGFDRNTGKGKGFTFFIYKSEKSAKSAIKEPMKTLDGVTLVCKPAPPRDMNRTLSKPHQGMPPHKPDQRMWAYGLPLTGFIPVGNLESPLFQQALLKNR